MRPGSEAVEQAPQPVAPGLLAALSLAFAGITVAMIAKLTVVDLDLFHQMALFRECLDLGRVPTADSFAYTPTLPVVVNHEIGTGAVLWAVSTASGAWGLIALKYALVAGVLGGSLALGIRRGASLITLMVCAPIGLMLAQIGFTTIRAQVFTLFFLTALMWLLQWDREGRRAWVLLWLSMHYAWGLMHAGVVVGLGLMGMHWIDRVVSQWRSGAPLATTARDSAHLPGLLVAGPILLCLGPYGLDYLPYLLGAVTMKRPLIGEWNSLLAVGAGSEIALWVLSVLVAVYALAADKKREVFPALALAVTALLAFRTFRHVSLYGVVWLSLVPALLSGSEVDRTLVRVWGSARRAIIGVALAFGLVGWSVGVYRTFWELKVPAVPANTPPGAPIYPQGAVDWLAQQDFHGNLTTPFAVGAFVSWKLYPAVLVSLDSRYEAAYPHGALEESVGLYATEPGWRDALDHYDTHAVLVPAGGPLAQALEADPRSVQSAWAALYRDDAYAVYVRGDRLGGLAPADRRGERIEGRFP